MQKLLLFTALTTFSFGSLACSTHSQANRPYIKAHIGVVKGQNTKDIVNQIYKSNPTIMGTIALGYNVRDNLRADLSLDYYPNLRFSTDNSNTKIDAKLKTSSVLINFYMDIAAIHYYKIFVGAGAGTSRSSINVYGLDKTNNQPFSIRYIENNKFTYGLYAGTHYEYTQGIHAELMYSYKDLGAINDSKLKIHNFTAGIRFDL